VAARLIQQRHIVSFASCKIRKKSGINQNERFKYFKVFKKTIDYKEVNMKKQILMLSIFAVCALMVASVSAIVTGISIDGTILNCDSSGYTCGIVNVFSPTFNGSFVAGSTLYTDTIHVTNSMLYGKDVYKLADSITTKKVCENKTYTIKVPVCENILKGYRTKIINKIRTQVPYYKKVCHIETVVKTELVCKKIRTPIMCPTTNQLSLSNFKMKINDGEWQNVPYAPNQIRLIDSDVEFRVDIPRICSPVYQVNKAIFLINRLD